MANSSATSHLLGMPLGSAPSTRIAFGDPPAKRTSGSVAAEISTEIAGLFRDLAGRGPTKAKTRISGDLVLVQLEGCLTTLEKHLASCGEVELITSVRHAVHDVIREDAIAIVEARTGRRVAAYLHEHQQDFDVAVVAFVLDPPEGPLEL